jgi:hypothetical protein
VNGAVRCSNSGRTFFFFCFFFLILQKTGINLLREDLEKTNYDQFVLAEFFFAVFSAFDGPKLKHKWHS